MQSLKAGVVVDGKFEILTELGSGGMGTVYKARQTSLERVVAIKILHSIALTDDESIKRFEREARALALLNDKHITQFLDFGFWHEHIPYLSMEYVGSTTLRQVLNKKERLSWKQALSIASQMAEALSICHAKGIIHRDIKPENVFVETSPEICVKLADFGLAKLSGSDYESGNTLTKTGLLIGSPYYMSPEQGQGLPADHRSDIYSLGCVLLEMLSGARPFEADTALGIMLKKNNEVAPSLETLVDCSGLPKELSALVAQTLEKDPALRPQKAAEIRTKIDMLLTEHKDWTDKIAIVAPDGYKQSKKSTLIFSCSAFCILAGLVVLAVVKLPSRSPTKDIDPGLPRSGVTGREQNLSLFQISALSNELARTGQQQRAITVLEKWLKYKRTRITFPVSEEAQASKTLAELQTNDLAVLTLNEAIGSIKKRKPNAVAELCELLSTKIASTKKEPENEKAAVQLADLLSQHSDLKQDTKILSYTVLANYYLNSGKIDLSILYLDKIKLPAESDPRAKYRLLLQKSALLFAQGKKDESAKMFGKLDGLSTESGPEFQTTYRTFFPASKKFLPDVYRQTRSTKTLAPEHINITENAELTFWHHPQLGVDFATMVLKLNKLAEARAQLLQMRAICRLSSWDKRTEVNYDQKKPDLKQFMLDLAQAEQDLKQSVDINKIGSQASLLYICQTVLGKDVEAAQTIKPVLASTSQSLKAEFLTNAGDWIIRLDQTPCPFNKLLNCYLDLERIYALLPPNSDIERARKIASNELDGLCVRTLQRVFDDPSKKAIAQIDEFSKRPDKSKSFSSVLCAYRGQVDLRKFTEARHAGKASNESAAAALSHFQNAIRTYESDDYERGRLKYYLDIAHMNAALLYLAQNQKPEAVKELETVASKERGIDSAEKKISVLGFLSTEGEKFTPNDNLRFQCFDLAQYFIKNTCDTKNTKIAAIRIQFVNSYISPLLELRKRRDFTGELKRIGELEKLGNSELSSGALNYLRWDCLIRNWGRKSIDASNEKFWNDDIDKAIASCKSYRNLLIEANPKAIFSDSARMVSCYYLLKGDLQQSREVIETIISSSPIADRDKIKFSCAKCFLEFSQLFNGQNFAQSLLACREYARLCESLSSPNFAVQKKQARDLLREMEKDPRNKVSKFGTKTFWNF